MIVGADESLDDFCTATEAGAILGVSSQTVHRWGAHGVLTPRHAFGVRLFLRAEVEQTKRSREKERGE